MTWWNGPLCGFDLESTGVNVETARIVTAAIVYVGGGLSPETTTLLVDPGIEIPAEAAAVHGVTTERARTEGVAARDGIMAVRIALAAGIRAGRPLIVMNARYDLTVLDRELRRHELDPLPAAHVIDPLVVDRWLDKYRRGSRKLDALCAHYGATLDGAHDAAHDAIAACRVAWVLGARGQVVRQAWKPEMVAERDRLQNEWKAVRNDLPALHEAQQRWAHEQAVGLAEHFRRTGKADPDQVHTDWPLVPRAA